MQADSDNEIQERVQRRDSGASHPYKVLRHGASGQYVEGPSMPDMNHEVVQIDLGDSAQQVAMMRTAPTSMPDVMPASDDIDPAANALDNLGDLSRLTE